MIILQVTIDELTTLVQTAVKDALAVRLQPAMAIAPQGLIKGITGLEKFLQVSHATAQDYKNAGAFEYFQNGRLILFDAEKVMEAMKDPAKVQAAMLEYYAKKRRAK